MGCAANLLISRSPSRLSLLSKFAGLGKSQSLLLVCNGERAGMLQRHAAEAFSFSSIKTEVIKVLYAFTRSVALTYITASPGLRASRV